MPKNFRYFSGFNSQFCGSTARPIIRVLFTATAGIGPGDVPGIKYGSDSFAKLEPKQRRLLFELISPCFYKT
jgi:hypothetical protein